MKAKSYISVSETDIGESLTKLNKKEMEFMQEDKRLKVRSQKRKNLLFFV